MYNKIQRNDCYITKLKVFIANEYDIIPLSISTANHGFYGETWKINTHDKSYFVKLVYATTFKQTYEKSFVLIDYLTNCKLDFIPKLITTKTGELYTIFDNAVMGIFEWVDGENVQNDVSKKAEYSMLATVYSLNYPHMNIPKEDFSGCGSAEFYDRVKAINCTKLNAWFDDIADIITYRTNRLHIFSERCKGNTSHFYITHGDAGGNVVHSGDAFYLVDWDIVKFAPPERDAWFCIGWQGAGEMFEHSLATVGIEYKLNPDRLAYYAYYYYFYYLNEYLKAYVELTDKHRELLSDIKSFSTGWIEESFIFADKIE